MKLFRNAEVRKTAGLFALVTLLFAGAAAFISPLCSLLLLCCGAVLFLLFLFSEKKRYAEIALLSETVDRAVHSAETTDFSCLHEGELAVLESEITKLFSSLREKNEMLTNEKIVLSDSLADISHQIRTPLTSINLVLSLLQKPEVTDERRAELIAELYSLLDSTDRLVTTLLKIAKLDAGAVSFAEKEVSVAECVEKAIRMLEIAFEIRSIRLVREYSDERFTGDADWTAEAIGNILKNCMEHTPENGTVTVTSEETPIYTLIRIRDTGEGIAEADLPHLFERFYRGGQGAGNANFGIGLNLASMIVKKQNGTLKAMNAPDGGAVFEIKFYKVTV